MAYWHISDWTKAFYPSLIWDYRKKSKTIYLTFDDGPTPVVTQQVLDLLKQYNAKASFFCLGRNVERHSEEFRAILDAGHTVGNHTYSHLKGWKSDNDEYYRDIELANTLIHSKLFRPPYGQITRPQIKYLRQHYRIIMWEVMSHDYDSRIDKDRSLKSVLKYARSGSILVFHDSVKASEKLFYMLPRVLEHFSKKGYTFERIE
jgi:peptidoglycan/xylan/chitin deacetylase (PgdA/CDA1 family)